MFKEDKEEVERKYLKLKLKLIANFDFFAFFIFFDRINFVSTFVWQTLVSSPFGSSIAKPNLIISVIVKQNQLK